MQGTLSVTAIPTDLFPRRGALPEFLVKHLRGCDLENKVLAITSKIVSLAEDRLVSRAEISKHDLVQKEADSYLTPGGFGVELTIAKGILIPSAGIDESNSADGSYILYPENPFQTAETLGRTLKKHFKLKNFGVILTDSHSTPLRRGVTGISLAHWGFRAVNSLVGQEDLYQKPLKFTHVNVADSLAAMAVLSMGEANNRTPLALLAGGPVDFTEDSRESEIRIEPAQDLYFPLIKPFL